MLLNKKIVVLAGALLLLVPVVTFLSNTNLPQILVEDIFLIIISQLTILISIIIANSIFHKLFLKKFLKIEIFLLINFFTIYLLFFFKNIKNLFYSFENFHFLFDEIFTLFIYGFIYFLLIRFYKKYINFLSRFLLIYISAVLFISFLNMFNFQFNGEKNSLPSSDFDNVSANSNQTNIFLIILDGMINLEPAKKLKIIENKNKIINSLNKNNYTHKEDFFSNYNTSYLSIASLLQSSYPATEDSKKYYNRKKFFPSFILNEKRENTFFKVLKKTKKQFFWVGNEWFFCRENLYINCLSEDPVYKKISRLKLFYSDSIFIYFLSFYSPQIPQKGALNFLINPNLKLDNTNQNGNIFLIHALSPHPPFIFNQDCKIKDKINDTSIDEEIKYYSFAYNCLLEIVNNFTRKIEKNNANNMFFVMGDHGWSFDKSIMDKVNLDPKEIRFKPFFSYNIPPKCKNILSPKSIVNILRFALICDGNKNIKYLKDLKFKSFYEEDLDYGKVYLKN